MASTLCDKADVFRNLCTGSQESKESRPESKTESKSEENTMRAESHLLVCLDLKDMETGLRNE